MPDQNYNTGDGTYIVPEAAERIKAERDTYQAALTMIVLQSCNGHTQPDSTLRQSLAAVRRTASDALKDAR